MPLTSPCFVFYSLSWLFLATLRVGGKKASLYPTHMCSRGKVIPLGMYMCFCASHAPICVYVHTSGILLATNSPPQALLEAHSFIYKLITNTSRVAQRHFIHSTISKFLLSMNTVELIYTPNDHTTVWACLPSDPVPTPFMSLCSGVWSDRYI